MSAVAEHVPATSLATVAFPDASASTRISHSSPGPGGGTVCILAASPDTTADAEQAPDPGLNTSAFADATPDAEHVPDAWIADKNGVTTSASVVLTPTSTDWALMFPVSTNW